MEHRLIISTPEFWEGTGGKRDRFHMKVSLFQLLFVSKFTLFTIVRRIRRNIPEEDEYGGKETETPSRYTTRYSPNTEMFG